MRGTTSPQSPSKSPGESGSEHPHRMGISWPPIPPVWPWRRPPHRPTTPSFPCRHARLSPGTALASRGAKHRLPASTWGGGRGARRTGLLARRLAHGAGLRTPACQGTSEKGKAPGSARPSFGSQQLLFAGTCPWASHVACLGPPSPSNGVTLSTSQGRCRGGLTHSAEGIWQPLSPL